MFVLLTLVPRHVPSDCSVSAWPVVASKELTFVSSCSFSGFSGFQNDLSPDELFVLQKYCFPSLMTYR